MPITSPLHDFMQRIASETYAEPRSAGHDTITGMMAPRVAERIPMASRILDIGSGTGPALEWFTKAGYDIIGTDINEGNRHECAKQGYVVYGYDQNDMPLSWNGLFDCVWARHVLEHSVCPLFTLHEIRRVLKIDGTLYVEVPGPNTPCLHEANANHYSVLGLRMWVNLITRAGFKIMDSKTITFETPSGPDEYYSFIAEKL